MGKLELTISSDYVPEWTIVDAVRELFQNAFDQEIQNPENKAAWHYNPVTEVLSIRNDSSELSTSSLLLGATTKAGDTATVGQFGEGYKLATLVLLRNHKQVVFYNRKEVWRPRFVKSRRFGAEVLTFFTEPHKGPANDGLVIQVGGISTGEYSEIVKSNLYLQDSVDLEVKTDYGEILGRAYAGSVFINGLYVCNYSTHTFGYNFKPGLLELGRDRKLVSSFEFHWLTAKTWASAPLHRVCELVEEGLVDVMYLSSQLACSWLRPALPDELHRRFIEAHGPRSVPVTTHAELRDLPPSYNGVITTANHASLIKASPNYVAPERVAEEDPLMKLWGWFNSVASLLPTPKRDEFNDIFEKVKQKVR